MVEGGRAVRARGACTKSPSVRACVGLAPLSLAPGGDGAVEQRGKGGTGRGFPLLAPPPAQGREVVLRRGWKRGYCPGRGRFPRPVRKPALFNDEAARQVLREVLEELGCGSRAVGQLQLLQLLKLHEARQPRSGQKRAACNREASGQPLSSSAPPSRRAGLGWAGGQGWRGQRPAGGGTCTGRGG